MPGLYFLFCENCEKELLGRDLTDWGKWQDKGKCIHNPNFVLLQDGGNHKILRHPAEGSDLREAGYTWKQATEEGRLALSETKICERCGSLNDDMKLWGPTSDSCASILLTAAGFVGFAITLIRRSPQYWLLLFAASYWIHQAWMSKSNRTFQTRFLEKIKKISLTNCHCCGHSKFVSLDTAIQQKLPCPKCQQVAQTCHAIGIA